MNAQLIALAAPLPTITASCTHPETTPPNRFLGMDACALAHRR